MIPEVVNISGFITVTIETLGAIIAVIIGGFFTFLVIKKWLKWGNQLDGSSSSVGDRGFGYHTDGTPIGDPNDVFPDDNYESSTRTRTVVFRKME